MKITLIQFFVIIIFFSLVACNPTKLETQEIKTGTPLITKTNKLTTTITSTPSPSPTLTLTPTNTSTATLTPSPVYSKLGDYINILIDKLGWEIILCGEDVINENLNEGIILYRIDTQEFFCDFKGFTEPAPTPAPGQFQYFLVFGENFDDPGNYWFELVGSNTQYFPYPSLYNVDPDVTAQMVEISSYAVRYWPLNEEEFQLFFNEN